MFLNAVVQTLGSRAASEGLTTEEMKKIGQATGVQGIFHGTVTQYDMVATPSGSFPVISVEARLLDVETGTVVWKATATARGGPKTPIIGIGEIHTLGELSQKLSRVLVEKI